MTHYSEKLYVKKSQTFTLLLLYELYFRITKQLVWYLASIKDSKRERFLIALCKWILLGFKFFAHEKMFNIISHFRYANEHLNEISLNTVGYHFNTIG